MLLRRYFIGLTAAVLSIGCGGENADGIQRVAVSGEVTLDGQPLESGYVSFIPKSDGPSAGGEILSGSYSISKALGPAAGEYRVEVRSMVPTGRKIPNYDGADGEMMEELYDQIPPKYNTETQLVVEIKSGSANTHDLKMQGRLSAPKPGSTKKSGRNR